MTTEMPFVYPQVRGSPVLFDIRYGGSDEYKIFVVDSVGQNYERLLTTERPIGPYQGVRALPYRDGKFEDGVEASVFKIRVDGGGAWTVRVGLPNFAGAPIDAVTGRGDLVIGPFNLTGSGPGADYLFEVSHTGANFSARLIADDGTWRPLIPRQTTSFTNRRAPVNVHRAPPSTDDLPYGRYVLAIEADGPWTVRLIER